MRADLEPEKIWGLSCACWSRRALMCRQADYLQPDCVLFSDKCSAINEFCVTRRIANASIAMAIRTADHNRLSQAVQRAEKESSWAGPMETNLSSIAGCWLVNIFPTVMCYMATCTDTVEDKTSSLETQRCVGVWPGAPPLQGQIGVKPLYQED